MAKAICRASKMSGGGSCGSADAHLERERETKNADEKKKQENRRLIGDKGKLYDKVKAVIEEHGGKPRKDSVECVEFFFGASPEHFQDDRGGHDMRKVEAFERQSLVFISQLEARGWKFVKAMTHMDERTPHITAFAVPIDPTGKLNCKHHLGGRAKLAALQDEFAEAMKPCGLERGERGSKATHQRVQQFYSTIMEEVRPQVDCSQLSDPPERATPADLAAYKLQIATEVARQLATQMTQMRDQSLLAIDERRQREQFEQELEDTRDERDRAADLAHHFGESISQLSTALSAERAGHVQTREELRRAADRVRGIPMTEVLEVFGQSGVRSEERRATFYRNQQGVHWLTITDDDRAFDHANRLVARNAIDLTMYIMKHQNPGNASSHAAIRLLAERFGVERAGIVAGIYTIERLNKEVTSERREPQAAERSYTVPTQEAQPTDAELSKASPASAPTAIMVQPLEDDHSRERLLDAIAEHNRQEEQRKLEAARESARQLEHPLVPGRAFYTTTPETSHSMPSLPSGEPPNPLAALDERIKQLQLETDNMPTRERTRPEHKVDQPIEV